jgi:GAF domain-containing protein
VNAAGLAVELLNCMSYQAIIAVPVMAGESLYGILTLDASRADSLGQPDLEIMKTLASLLGVGLALDVSNDKPRVQVPAQGNRELP